MYRSLWDVQSCHLARLREHLVRMQEPLTADVGESRNLQQDLFVQHMTLFRWVLARQHLPSSPSQLPSYGNFWKEIIQIWSQLD